MLHVFLTYEMTLLRSHCDQVLLNPIPFLGLARLLGLEGWAYLNLVP